MGDLIPKNTDDEMERYSEAEMIRRARIPMENNAALVYEVDPVSKREAALFPLSSGGYVKIGDRAVTPAQAAETDVLAAQGTVQNDGRTPIGKVMGGADGPTMEDYEAAGFTEAEVIQFQAQDRAEVLSQPGVQVPADLTPEQIQMGADAGAPMLTTREPGVFEGGLSELGKGLVRGGLVEPSRFLKENFNIYDPLVFQFVDPKTGEFDPQLKIVSREEKAEIDRAMAAGEMPYAVDFEQLFETGDASQVGPGAQIVGGISQFIGAFAGVGKIFRIGKGFTGAATQGAAADFLGFGGNDGRLTDLLLELGMPENVVTDLLKTDPNNPDYVGRIKNAFEGGVLGAIAEPIARTIGMLARGGSRAELAQSIADLRTKSETAFSNGISNIIGTGRAIMQGDTEMLGEVFQPSGTARSLGAAAPDPNAAAGAIIRPDDVYRGEGTPRITVRETNEPFVVRGTQQNQIDDMIQSGLIRPKPGGYGQDNKSSIYFGESSEALPTNVFGRPSEDRFVLVGDSDKLAGTEGPIPIDQLRHVWAVRDGETVDILPEILRANREFDNFGAAGAGAAGAETTALTRNTPEYLSEIGVAAPRSLGAAAPDPETAGAITAFHGSPYDFDAFDITKMGTGEGAQAYGPGLYFAEAEDVAREYRDSMLDARIPPVNDRLRELAREMNEISTGYRQWRSGQEDRGRAIAAEYDDLMDQRSSMRGRLYEVNIRANPEDFLNWDAPISQQSEKVREALMPFVERRIAQMGEAGNRFTAEQWMDRLRGGDVMLLDKVEDTPVSNALIKAGVPGVRYLDQSSRATGEGTRNIVVFDDQLIDIVRKYGVAGLAVGAAVQSELGGNQQIEENI